MVAVLSKNLRYTVTNRVIRVHRVDMTVPMPSFSIRKKEQFFEIFWLTLLLNSVHEENTHVSGCTQGYQPPKRPVMFRRRRYARENEETECQGYRCNTRLAYLLHGGRKNCARSGSTSKRVNGSTEFHNGFPFKRTLSSRGHSFFLSFSLYLSSNFDRIAARSVSVNRCGAEIQSMIMVCLLRCTAY